MKRVLWILAGLGCFFASCASVDTAPNVKPLNVVPTVNSDSPRFELTITSVPQATLLDSEIVVKKPSPLLTPTISLVNSKQELPASEVTSFEALEFGKSVQGRSLTAYRFGNGATHRALIGGIHGGYELNTVQLMSETLSYLKENLNLIPKELTLFIIPNMNPDGVARGNDAITGRMNANNVDLNRNWDYKWQITATHGIRPVFSGKEPFSEPETRSVRDFIQNNKVSAVIFYHSAYGSIFSGADLKSAPKTNELAKMMAKATGYLYRPEGIIGQITTGDAVDYLTSQGIDAIEVELTTHQATDWKQNLSGLKLFLSWDIISEPQLKSTSGIPVKQQKIYIVQLGDTLGLISLRSQTTIEDLIRLNDLTNPNEIYAGQRLILP